MNGPSKLHYKKTAQYPAKVGNYHCNVRLKEKLLIPACEGGGLDEGSEMSNKQRLLKNMIRQVDYEAEVVLQSLVVFMKHGLNIIQSKSLRSATYYSNHLCHSRALITKSKAHVQYLKL
jgi:hypothetical protein